jgi:hypothetical protein
MTDPGHGTRGKDDTADGKQSDGPSRLFEVNPRSGPGGSVENWRKENEKYDFGIEFDSWKIRDQPNSYSSQHQQDRVRYPDLVSNFREGRYQAIR